MYCYYDQIVYRHSFHFALSAETLSIEILLLLYTIVNTAQSLQSNWAITQKVGRMGGQR